MISTDFKAGNMIKKKRKKNEKLIQKQAAKLIIALWNYSHIKKLIVQYLITEYRILFMKYMAGQKSSYYVIKMCNKIQVAI